MHRNIDLRATSHRRDDKIAHDHLSASEGVLSESSLRQVTQSCLAGAPASYIVYDVHASVLEEVIRAHCLFH